MSAWSLIMTSSQWIHQTFSGVCQHDTWHGPVIHTRDIISSLPPITGLISRLSPVFLFWNATQNKCYILSKFREFLNGRRRQSLIRETYRETQSVKPTGRLDLYNEPTPTDPREGGGGDIHWWLIDTQDCRQSSDVRQCWTILKESGDGTKY